MDYNVIGKAGSRMGTGTMIILDDQTCPVGMVLNLFVSLPTNPVVSVLPVVRGCPGHDRCLKI